MSPPSDLVSPRPAPAKKRRVSLFSVSLVVWTFAALVALWYWLPFQPHCVIDVEPDSFFVGFSPDGTQLLTLGYRVDDGVVKSTGPIQLWSIATQERCASFMGRGDVLDSVSWGVDGQSLLATRHGDGRFQVFDVATGRECANVRAESGWIFPGGRILGFNTGLWATTPFKLWDLVTDREIGTYGIGGWLALSPDAKRLVTWHALQAGSSPPPDELFLWDVPRGRLIARLDAAIGAAVHFSSDNQFLAVDTFGQQQWRVFLYDAATGQQIDKLSGARHPQFTGDERTLVTLDSTNLVAFRDVAGRRVIHTSQIANGLSVGNLQISPDGRILAGDVWDPRPGFNVRWVHWSWLAQLISEFELRRSDATALRLWDAATGHELASLPMGQWQHFSPNGKLFAAKEQNDSKIRVWDVPPRWSWGLFALLSLSLAMAMATLAQWLYQLAEPESRPPPARAPGSATLAISRASSSRR
jgi:WD40 repeat protein